MADYRMNQLQEALIAEDTDIFHLRTTGGLDKKITGKNLRKTTGAIVLEYSTTQTVNLALFSADVIILCDTSGGAWTLTLSGTLTTGRRVSILASGSNDLTVTYTASGGSHSFVMRDTEEVQLLSNGSSLLVVKGKIRLWRGSTNANLSLTTIFGNSGIAYRAGPIEAMCTIKISISDYLCACVGQYPDTFSISPIRFASLFDNALRTVQLYSTYIYSGDSDNYLKEINILL